MILLAFIPDYVDVFNLARLEFYLQPITAYISSDYTQFNVFKVNILRHLVPLLDRGKRDMVKR